MNFKTKTATLTAGLALMAAPAFAAGEQPSTIPPGYTSESNPGTEYQPTEVPPSYDGDTNPGTESSPGYDGQNNPGTAHVPTRAEARAIGREQCAGFKSNFKTNRSAFGRCVAAVASALRSDDTPAQACEAKRLSRTRRDGQARSDFRACVRAARNAEEEQSQNA